MKIALYGATGNVGSRLLAEALRRGHDVTAVVRDPARLSVTDPRLTVVTGDATDPAGVASAVAGHDAVIGSISGRRDHDAGKIAAAARALIEGARKAGVRRVLWVGGAGTLEVAPGRRLLDSPDFPEAYKSEANAGAEALEAFRGAPEGVDWSYLSPAAEIGPGERTSLFRLGGDEFMTDAAGKSFISFEDYAVAMLDEVENPKHVRRRFSVAY